MNHEEARPHRSIQLAVILWTLFGLIAASPLATGSARALTLTSCSRSSCEGILPRDIPRGDVLVADLSDFPIVSGGPIGGLSVEAGSSDVAIQVAGDVVIRLASGVLSAKNVELRSAGKISIRSVASLAVTDVLRIGCPADCGPLEPETALFDLPASAEEPFWIEVLGPIEGDFSVYAGGDLTLLAVPEPGATLLIGLGLAGLAGARRPRPGQ